MLAGSALDMLRLKVSSNIWNLHARGRALSRRIVQLLYSYQSLGLLLDKLPYSMPPPTTVL
jgi:hypothetical protein